MRGEMPMDVEHELGWRCSGKQRQVRCTHLSPLKKRKMEPSHEEEGHTQMVKYPSDALGLVTKKARRPSVVNIARVPVVLIGYLHLLLNSVVIGFICYVVVYVLVGLQRDIGYKMISRRAQIQHQIEEAKTSYRINKCDPATRVPAIEELCSKWECVIKNGYRSVGYTRIIAEVFGDVMDGFVRKFSVRSSLTIGFFFVLFLVFRRAAKA
ncbi:di-sulfide bridge nucleocytoplasmic transport domain-containing protein [Encephalitozoon cuniculi]|nr:di-sulfide bridge nucleocytoplasmic transport domain-containing protein [Encephalitozoon cuniculi]